MEAGFAKVVGTDVKIILAAIEENLGKDAELPSLSPYGEGTAAKKMYK